MRLAHRCPNGLVSKYLIFFILRHTCVWITDNTSDTGCEFFFRLPIILKTILCFAWYVHQCLHVFLGFSWLCVLASIYYQGQYGNDNKMHKVKASGECNINGMASCSLSPEICTESYFVLWCSDYIIRFCGKTRFSTFHQCNPAIISMQFSIMWCIYSIVAERYVRVPFNMHRVMFYSVLWWL